MLSTKKAVKKKRKKTRSRPRKRSRKNVNGQEKKKENMLSTKKATEKKIRTFLFSCFLVFLFSCFLVFYFMPSHVKCVHRPIALVSWFHHIARSFGLVCFAWLLFLIALVILKQEKPFFLITRIKFYCILSFYVPIMYNLCLSI